MTDEHETVVLRDGTVVHPDGTQGRWRPAQKCPQCGEMVWRIRHDRYGNINTHMDKFGVRGECSGKKALR